MLIDLITDRLKATSSVDYALRYNPVYYRSIRRQLQDVRGMDLQARRTRADQLLRRTFEWAARLPDGLPAAVPLSQRPIIEREQLRDHPRRYTVPGWIRVPAATSGSTGIPVRLSRSLLNVAAEQAFIDDLLSARGFDLRRARIARLRADVFKPVSDSSPPFGELRDSGTKLILSSNHLNADSANWYFEALRDFRPDVMFVHPSAAESLAGFLQLLGRQLDVPLLLSASEAVLPSGRRLMEEIFNATLIDYYGMAERSLFAAGSSTEAMFFNPLYGHAELLPVPAAEAPAGACAFEIIGTGYWNDAMPLVRYRSGDRAIVPDWYGPADLEAVALGLRPVLAIQGRGKEHLLSPSGVTIIGMSNATNGIKGLVRMQLVQDALDRVRADVIVDPAIGTIDEEQLLRNMRGRLSDNIEITIRRVQRLERLPSGKTPFIIQRSALPSPAQPALPSLARASPG
jgi:phenylacetate-CoA ligase